MRTYHKMFIIDQYDKLVYWFFYESINRYISKNPGIQYLIELSLRDAREKYPLSPELMEFTENFHIIIKDFSDGKIA